MVRDLRHYCHNDNPDPGGAWTWAGAGGPRIVNLMTQDAAADIYVYETFRPGQRADAPGL